jgi:DNA repair exonuclease SbcCD ATPase subunit
LAESQRATNELNTRRQVAQERLDGCDGALSQAQKKRFALQKTIATDEQRLRDLQSRLRRLEGVRAQLTVLEQQRRELERQEVELGRFPSDLETRLSAAQAEHDELAGLATVVPVLARLIQARDDLRIARQRERRAAEQETAIKTRGEQLAAELTALSPQLEKATAERQRADDAASAAKALLKQAREEETAFREMEGARVCRQCGQDLTPAHFTREMAKRVAEVAEADAKVKETKAAQQVAQQAEVELQRQVAALEKERQEKREEYRDVRRQLDQAREQAERHAADCAAAYRDLSEPFRGRVSPAPPTDWLATTEPTSTELESLRGRSGKLDASRTTLRELQGQHVTWTGLRGQVQTLRQGVATLAAGLPGEPKELHRDFTRAEADELAVGGELKAARSEARVVQEELDRFTTERQVIESDLADIGGQLQSQEVTRKHSRQSLDAIMAALPESWRPQAEKARLTELHGWTTERHALVERGVEAKARELLQIRAGIEPLRQAKDELDRELAAFSEQARRPLDEVREGLATARRQGDQTEEHVRQAGQSKALLDDRRRRRSELHAMTLDVDREHNHAKMLAELLSRERLQLHLVRMAERQIVDHANVVLDRLSGGQLYLRIRPSEAGQEVDKALELEAYNRTTGGSAINVAFLSGSQRFRVAVSLALGIGQYASRAHRPIESVIIDEGFGCLDRNGRQVMIQELQNLRGHLHCILLVSHQEEFAEAFNDGYRFELANGTTQVTRIRR